MLRTSLGAIILGISAMPISSDANCDQRILRNHGNALATWGIPIEKRSNGTYAPLDG